MANTLTKHKLGFFQLSTLNIIAILSIRSPPFAAKLGFSLIFFYIVAGLMFFIPSGLVSAELGTGWPERGGIYVWVREAFGKRIALITIWFSWIYNIIWFPTITAVVAGVGAYLINPELAQNKIFMMLTVIALFWLVTYINLFGMRLSGVISSIGATIGTIIPLFIIIILGIVWLAKGNPSQITFSWKTFLPNERFADGMGYFTQVIYSLMGLEMVATHALEMKNPIRDYPKSIMVAMSLILVTLTLSALSIAIVVPADSLNIVVGTIQAFEIFFTSFHIEWMIPIIGICIIIGTLSGISAWVAGPSKGILVASHDNYLPKILRLTNSRGIQKGALIVQAIAVTIITLLFGILPSITGAFYILSIVTAQLAFVVYIILFATALKLHFHKAHVPRAFKVPGGNFGMWNVTTFGIVICLVAFVIGFTQPENINFGSPFIYEGILIGGMLILGSIPFILSKARD